VDVIASLDAPESVQKMYALVRDLATYPNWLDIVHGVQVVETQPAEDRAWLVELRGKVGPFARSKRLRMVRAIDEDPGRVVFERREITGRRNSAWVLTATIAATATGSNVNVHLHYGGTLFNSYVLERLLAEQISRGSERLLQLLAKN